MPELPDVEIFKQYLDATALHQEIKEVDVRSSQILKAISAEHLRQGLEGRCFTSTRRHGKDLFAALDNGKWLFLHFGMTGSLSYFKHLADDLEYDRLMISFANGYHLAYVSQRKLGELDLIESVDDFIEREHLGPDALNDLDRETFENLASGRRMMAKAFLMDQETLAGIGNVYSDEILFQAGVHPQTRIDQLDEAVVGRIYEKLQAVLHTAIDCRAEPDQFPDDYLTPHRHPDGHCPLCGEPVKRVKVSGRSAYYCPNRQGQEKAS
jgi:formamidopyrimidine-DNA glycosylase